MVVPSYWAHENVKAGSTEGKEWKFLRYWKKEGITLPGFYTAQPLVYANLRLYSLLREFDILDRQEEKSAIRNRLQRYIRPPFKKSGLLVLAIVAFIGPAEALDNNNPTSTLKTDAEGVTGDIGLNLTSVVIMAFIGIAAVLILTPGIRLSESRTVLYLSLGLVSWTTFMVNGYDIHPWLFASIWAYDIYNVLAIVLTNMIDLGFEYNYAVALVLAGTIVDGGLLASGLLDDILPIAWSSPDFWKALPHSITICTLISLGAVKFVQWVSEGLSIPWRESIRAWVTQISTSRQNHHQVTQAIELEEGTHQQNSEAVFAIVDD